MADVKVQDYPNSAVVIQDTDLFDLTVDLGAGAFESKRLTFAILRGILLGFRRFKISRDFNNFSFAGLEKNIEIFSLPAGYRLEDVLVRHEIAWAGPGINSVETEVGIVAELDRYIDPHDVFQAIGNKIFSDNVLNKMEDFVLATSIRANMRSIGANLDQLTDGEVDYYIYIKQFK